MPWSTLSTTPVKISEAATCEPCNIEVAILIVQILQMFFQLFDVKEFTIPIVWCVRNWINVPPCCLAAVIKLFPICCFRTSNNNHLLVASIIVVVVLVVALSSWLESPLLLLLSLSSLLMLLLAESARAVSTDIGDGGFPRWCLLQPRRCPGPRR